jgi:endonuclease YncB( thermonuclease family)
MPHRHPLTVRRVAFLKKAARFAALASLGAIGCLVGGVSGSQLLEQGTATSTVYPPETYSTEEWREIAPPVAPQPISFGGRRVIDGDTIAIGTDRFRVFGIAAPDAPREAKEQATAYANKLIAAGVICTPTGDITYQRLVANCWTASGDFAREMVAAGYAFDWPKYSHGKFNELQIEAQQQQRGLWGQGYQPGSNPNYLSK